MYLDFSPSSFLLFGHFFVLNIGSEQRDKLILPVDAVLLINRFSGGSLTGYLECWWLIIFEVGSKLWRFKQCSLRMKKLLDLCSCIFCICCGRHCCWSRVFWILHCFLKEIDQHFICCMYKQVVSTRGFWNIVMVSPVPLVVFLRFGFACCKNQTKNFSSHWFVWWDTSLRMYNVSVWNLRSCRCARLVLPLGWLLVFLHFVFLTALMEMNSVLVLERCGNRKILHGHFDELYLW